MNWNLEELFVNDEAFYEEINHVKRLLQEIKQYKDEVLNDNMLLILLNNKWYIKELGNNILVYGSLRYYKDIKNEECIKLKEEATKLNDEVDLELTFIDNKIIEVGIDKIKEYLKENKDLNIYNLYLDNLFRIQEHVISDNVINNKIKENKHQINIELNEYNNLLSDIDYGTIIIDREEVEITSANYSKYITSRDRKTRRDTYLAVNESFIKEQDKFYAILKSIYLKRIENAELEQYESVLDKTLSDENIDSKIISSLINSVNNNLNLIQEYLKLKSSFLEIKDPHLYDFTVPLDNNIKVKYSIEESIEIVKEALKPLGNKYLEVVDILLNNHIDAIPDDKKHQSITFSWNSYSFMNFRGSYNDIKNLIHELGHIVNYYLSKEKQPYIYEDSTVFVGETASLVNEILLNRYLYKKSETDEERLFYLSKEIENYFTSVYKKTMYTEFENSIYSLIDSDVDTICNKYSSLIKKYYGNSINYEDMSSIEWTRLGHLYRWSYYPYKYATGLIMASLVVDSLLDSNTLSKEQYIKFLESGKNQYSLDLLKMLDIDLSNENTINNGFNVLKKDINNFKDLVEKNLYSSN